ncbi:MAG TPA: AAA family ATPase, partial [Pyrinomonadaceae bacterium]|nr:AAA family ATPase [Pyrinomonadaceae bacterium]
KLESERLGVDNRLSEVNRALTERKHLDNQRRAEARETERLTRTVAQLEREARELERASQEAERAPALEAEERELTGQAARLRAAIERDERVRAETRGGVCPILGEECTSFKEGRSFDSYFAEQLQSNRARLASVERESARVVGEVRAAREAEKAQARFETTRMRLAQERALLTEREASLARLDQQLAALPKATEALRDELQSELFAMDAMWKAAREDALRYAELESARERLVEIEREGKAKKEERDAVAAAASAAGRLEQDIRDADEALRALGDPRGRSVLLRAEAAREESLRTELQGGRDALAALEAQRREGEAALAKFTDLDARWAALAARREETATAHREYLESRSLADTLPARESEFNDAGARATQTSDEERAAREAHERAASVYDRERHDRERGALALARERAAATSAKLDAAREDAARRRAELERLDEVRAAWHEELRAIERLEELHETTDFVRDVLRQAGPLVTESYLYNISIEANQLFREITGEGGRALRWTKDYEIVVEDGADVLPFTNLSGGEQMVAALSVRLALLKQLSDIRVAFFDEPTVNMDAERRERLAQQLGQVRHFEQLFVISHDDAFEQTVDHVVPVTRATQEAA